MIGFMPKTQERVPLVLSQQFSLCTFLSTKTQTEGPKSKGFCFETSIYFSIYIFDEVLNKTSQIS